MSNDAEEEDASGEMYFGSSRSDREEEEPGFDSRDPVGQILMGFLPAPEDQSEVLGQLKQEELITIIQEDYQRARDIQGAERILAMRDLDAQVIDDRLMTVQARLERAEVCLEKEKALWTSTLAEFEESFQETVTGLKEHQAEELLLFEEFWGTEPKAIIPYSKASSRLQQMRSRQKRNAATGNYEVAEACQYDADMMQLEEEVAGAERAATGMMIEHRRILDKHERQLECVVQNGARHRTLIESIRDRKLHDWEQAIANYRNMLADPYLARARVHCQTRAALRSRDTGSVPVSPRTQSLMCDYLQMTNQGRLRLDSAAIVRCLHPQPQRRPLIPRTSKRFHGYRTTP
jgi:hypothetical protein